MVPPLPARRGLATEIWLLHACAALERAPEDLVRAFELAPPAQVFAAPDGEPHGLGGALAAGWGAGLVTAGELARPRSDEADAELAERAFSALEGALAAHAPARLFFVAGLAVLRVLVARALSIPLDRSHALCVDPGKLVLLRDDPHGLVLRRSNVLGPESRPGAPLPGTDGGREEPRSPSVPGASR